MELKLSERRHHTGLWSSADPAGGYWGFEPADRCGVTGAQAS